MSQPNKSVSSLVKTILYSRMFHSPLTKDELWRYLMSDYQISSTEFAELLKNSNQYIQEKNSYYFLNGDESSVMAKEKEKKQFREKMMIAKRATKLLSYIPTILFIGVSGSLAAGSAHEESDIDLFIITTSKSVWVSRFLSIVLLTIVNLRRKRGKIHAANKICLNSFVGVSKLGYFAHSQEIYTARELAQLYPLLNRNSTYEHLLEQNKWYRKFLPNAIPQKTEFITRSLPQLYQRIIEILNPICSFIQVTYMKKHRTKEVVEQELILLHPHDYKGEILKKFDEMLMEYDLLTKV